MAIFIAYFSRRDENYVGGELKILPIGNTEAAAGMLQQLTGGELFQIQPIQPYARDYNTCIEQARADQRRDARPELKEWPESLAGYDTIFLGYPNYWGTMPMAVFTFLERLDFTGKTICPFCTHEGSGMGRSEEDIRCLCPGADVRSGLPIRGAGVRNAQPLLEKWLDFCKK